MPNRRDRRRRAIYSALGPLHHEAPAEASEERSEELEHMRREIEIDDDAASEEGEP
jgi:hypothetical protein